MALTLDQIRQNENIKSDRFGMAAISYIFKAFGDRIRSKEYWPWGKDVNFPWNSDYEETVSNNNLYIRKDLMLAIDCLDEAIIRVYKEMYETETKYNDVSIKGFKKRLKELIAKLNTLDGISDKINETSKETTDKLAELENYE